MGVKVRGKVDILDLIRIIVVRGQPRHDDPCPVDVFFEPYDKTKNVWFEERALKTLNESITEHVRSNNLNVRDPNTFKYIEEFVGRMATNLYKNDLVGLEDVKEEQSDPYSAAKRQVAQYFKKL